MRAVMLAAGVGRRLHGDGNHELPKALLAFAGETLLSRHIRILRSLGVDGLALVVGHRADDVLAEAERVAPPGFVETVTNPRYDEGPVISLAAASPFLAAGDAVLFMDADVLYPAEMLRRLRGEPPNCLLYDRAFEPGEEPVKVCLRAGVPVDFGKRISEPHDTVGEWPGFLTMDAAIAAEVAEAARGYVARDETAVPYEDAMRDVMRHRPGIFGAVDITGVPWTEIDFPEDLARAHAEILPAVLAYEDEPDAG